MSNNHIVWLFTIGSAYCVGYFLCYNLDIINNSYSNDIFLPFEKFVKCNLCGVICCIGYIILERMCVFFEHKFVLSFVMTLLSGFGCGYMYGYGHCKYIFQKN